MKIACNLPLVNHPKRIRLMKKLSIRSLFLTSLLVVTFNLSSAAHAAHWTCWGRQNYSKLSTSSGIILRYAMDVCVRDDVRPLLVNVYLHDVNLSSNLFEYSKISIGVSVTDSKTGETKTITSNDSHGGKDLKEFLKGFQFTVPSVGKYIVKINNITLAFWNKDSYPFYSVYENPSQRSGYTNIIPIPSCR